MTPRELRHEIASASARVREAQKRDLALAWQTAAFAVSAWGGKLRSLPEYLAELERAATRLTPAAQHTQVALLSEYMGVPMQPISEEAKRALMRMKES